MLVGVLVGMVQEWTCKQLPGKPPHSLISLGNTAQSLMVTGACTELVCRLSSL